MNTCFSLTFFNRKSHRGTCSYKCAHGIDTINDNIEKRLLCKESITFNTLNHQHTFKSLDAGPLSRVPERFWPIGSCRWLIVAFKDLKVCLWFNVLNLIIYLQCCSVKPLWLKYDFCLIQTITFKIENTITFALASSSNIDT